MSDSQTNVAPLRRDSVLLVAAGMALMLTQYVAVREIGSTFFSTELVLLAGVVVSLIGPSIAYAVSHRISRTWLYAWGLLSVLVHLTMPVGLRVLVGALAARGFEAWAIGITLVLGSVFLCGFYAIFLPQRTTTPASLPRLYAAELAGALLALVVLFLSPSWRATLLVYWLSGALVVHIAFRRLLITAPVLAAVIGMAIFYPRLDDMAARSYLADYHELHAPTMVETTYSPYQRIDVVDENFVDGKERSLFLDGVPFYRSGDLDAFNVFLANVPGTLNPNKGQALVIGSGSFSSAAHLARLGYPVTVVELDGEVARMGFAHFAHVHKLAAGDIHLVIGDGRRFLAGAPEEFFDLVVLDVPAPYHVHTALLHTPSFYRLVKSRLTPRGVVALSLSDSFEGSVGRAVAASAAAAFEQVMVIETDSTGIGHLYASRSLPFSAGDVEHLARSIDDSAVVYEDAYVRERLADAAPLTARHLAAVLVMARDALPKWAGHAD